MYVPVYMQHIDVKVTIFGDLDITFKANYPTSTTF